MKKTCKKLSALILCALLAATPLSSCSSASTSDKNSTETAKPSDTGNQSETTDNNNDIQIDTYKAQIEYYMELTEALQNELINIKEEKYIDECEQKLIVTSLEDTIQELKATIAQLLKSTSQIPASGSFAADSLASKSEFQFAVENDQITIIGYTGTAAEVIIPSSMEGRAVVKIGEGAFKGTQITAVTIPSSVKEIDWFAFSGCTLLKSISIPPSVMSVGYGAFEHCPKTMVIKCSKGSYIEAFALSWGIQIDNE